MSEKVKVEELDPSVQDRLMGLFKGWKFARFGDAGYIMPETYKQDADDLRNMSALPDDVWVVTFARSGTTWTQEMVWLLKNNFDYETATQTLLTDRYVFLEEEHLFRPDILSQEQVDKDFASTRLTMRTIDSVPSPRFIKTHMPFSLLPPNLLDTTKVVYVARDPRDVAVSFYHLSRLFFNYIGDFKTYWDLFINDLVLFAPFFSHLKEAWALRHHKNMLFMFYEDMTMDLASSVKRVADFLGKDVTHEEIVKLCEHLDIKNFRNNKAVNMSSLLTEFVMNTNGEVFIRKGKSGGWREQFDAEMTAQAQAWLRENLADTDLRFPHQE